MNETERCVHYRCVVGHAIAPEELDWKTALWTLDAGARVRVCTEHGAPVAIRMEPLGTSTERGDE